MKTYNIDQKKFWDEYHALMYRAKADDGNFENLRQWYVDGADGQINWGEEGDFDQCVAIVGDHFDEPEAFCANRHYEAIGSWPGERGTH